MRCTSGGVVLHHAVPTPEGSRSSPSPVRRRILIYSPQDQALGARLASAAAARVPQGVCLLVRRGDRPSPDPFSPVAVLDLPPVPGAGRDNLGLRVLADIARTMRPDAVVVVGEPLGERGELAPTLAVLQAAGRPPARFLALNAGELASLAGHAGGRSLRALLDWYDHALVFADRDACAPHEPAALRDASAVGVSYVGGESAPAALDHAARRLVGA
jgi:hypothetical protein